MVSLEAGNRENAAMDESSSEKRTGLIVLFLIVVVIAGAWFLVQRSGALEAVDETVDVFVPDAAEMERRTSAIDEARRLTEVLNSR